MYLEGTSLVVGFSSETICILISNLGQQPCGSYGQFLELEYLQNGNHSNRAQKFLLSKLDILNNFC